MHIRNNVLHVLLYANKRRLKNSCTTSVVLHYYMNQDGFYCHDRLLATLDEVLKNSIGSFVDEICDADLKAIIDLLIFA